MYERKCDTRAMHTDWHCMMLRVWLWLTTRAFQCAGALKEDLLGNHPALGIALKQLKGTALSRPWYPDSSSSAQPGSLSQSQPGEAVPPTLQALSTDTLRSPPRQGGLSCQIQDSAAAKRQRLAQGHSQPPQPQQEQAPQSLPSHGNAAAERQSIVGAALQHDRGQLLFLGTGCAEPSKYRGSSGIHLRFHNGRCKDCPGLLALPQRRYS